MIMNENTKLKIYYFEKISDIKLLIKTKFDFQNKKIFT